MKKIEDMTLAQKQHIIEIEMRGHFMTMACDLEWTLLMIMTHCVPNPLEQRDFKEMKMHNKIECTICDLKEYKPDLYAEYENELLKLWEFKEFRNKIAHRRIDFVNGLESFVFRYVDIHEGKERLFEEKYNIVDVYKGIEEFRKLNLTLAKLFVKMTGMKNVPLE